VSVGRIDGCTEGDRVVVGSPEGWEDGLCVSVGLSEGAWEGGSRDVPVLEQEILHICTAKRGNRWAPTCVGSSVTGTWYKPALFRPVPDGWILRQLPLGSSSIGATRPSLSPTPILKITNRFFIEVL